MATETLGSYGLSFAFNIGNGLVTGDKWTVSATASQPTNARTLLLAHNLPTAFTVGSTAVQVTLFIRDNVTLPIRSQTVGQYNYSVHPTELRVNANVTLLNSSWTVSGTPEPLPLVSPVNMVQTTASCLSLTEHGCLPPARCCRSPALTSWIRWCRVRHRRLTR